MDLIFTGPTHLQRTSLREGLNSMQLAYLQSNWLPRLNASNISSIPLKRLKKCFPFRIQYYFQQKHLLQEHRIRINGIITIFLMDSIFLCFHYLAQIYRKKIQMTFLYKRQEFSLIDALVR